MGDSKIDAKLVSREEDIVNIDITVPREKLNSALQSVYAKIANSQKIDGFRRGKVPRDIIERMFGKENIHAQVLQDLLPEVYSLAIEELNITPIDSPDFDPWPTIEEDADLIVHTKVEVLPEFQLCDIDTIPVDIEQKVQAMPDEVEETILNMKKSKGTYEDVERAAKQGDRVDLDYKLKLVYIAGKEPDTDYDERNGVQIHLGDEEILPDIENNLEGLKAGEEKDFIVKYPDNYQNDDLKNKSVSVHVKINKIEQRNLPEENEDFFKEAGAKDMDDLKTQVQENLVQYKTRIRDNALRERVIAVVLEQTHLNVPEKLVEEEVESRMQKLEDMLANNPDAPSFEEVLAQKGITEEQLRDEESKAAGANIKKRIIFDEIFIKENMEITPEEMTMALARYASENGLKKSQIKKIAKNREFMSSVRTELKDEKVTQLLVSRAKFKDQEDAKENHAEAAPAEQAEEAPAQAEENTAAQDNIPETADNKAQGDEEE